MSAELKALMLREPRLTLAVAESLTAGNVQAGVAAVAGASDYFLGGVTAYTLEQKVRHLGVDRAAAEKVNCVSAEVAEQMACGVCASFGADLGVATTGYAEPSDEQRVEVPFAWWAVAWRRPDGAFVMRQGRIECPGLARVAVQREVAARVLGELESFVREIRRGV